MNILFFDGSWKDYLYWQEKDRKILRKVNELIKDIQRDPFEGVGKPEPLKYDLSGLWSRRINHEHRIVYKVLNDETVGIVSCRFHYN